MSEQTLRDELANDPLARGYSGMTVEEVFASLTAVDRTVTVGFLEAAEIFDAINIGEYQNLAAGDKDSVALILGLSGPINVGSPSNARTILANAFDSNSDTRIALLKLIDRTVSRAEELGIAGWLTGGRIKKARL